MVDGLGDKIRASSKLIADSLEHKNKKNEK